MQKTCRICGKVFLVLPKNILRNVCKECIKKEYLPLYDGVVHSVDKGSNLFENLEWEVNKSQDVGKEKL